MYFRIYLGLRAFSPLTLGFHKPGRCPDEDIILKIIANLKIIMGQEFAGALEEKAMDF